MSPAHVLEPTYRRLKRGLMEGLWARGQKLEALRLADDFGVSMTPVRDCLNRLAGETMVEMKPGEGYRAVRIGERDFREMLETNEILVQAAIAREDAGCAIRQSEPRGSDYADRVAAIFSLLAAHTGNSELVRTVDALSDRLHVVRRLEPEIFLDADEELDRLAQLAYAHDPRLSSCTKDYHARRSRAAAQLIRRLS